jgi:hypothetical protein
MAPMRNAFTTSAILVVLLASSSLSVSPAQAEPSSTVPVILTPPSETPMSSNPVIKREIRHVGRQPSHKFTAPVIQYLTVEREGQEYWTLVPRGKDEELPRSPTFVPPEIQLFTLEPRDEGTESHNRESTETAKSAKSPRSWVVQKRLGVDLKPEARHARAQPEAHKFKPPEIQILTSETREQSALRRASESLGRQTQENHEFELIRPDPLHDLLRW